ncbi:uracil-DNA glycosylase [Pseudotabrizicola sp. 4114]|uniref:uracil-DNA glycosylase n=1 Tax=Pseudotabrizicola sp. 4114 TaxID=2817731 RepID=UPI00285A4729|nr:DNA polymerase [Pseudorhodobacter sp. 4114]
MGIASDILADWHASQAALLWQVDLGIDEWLLDEALNRYDLPEAVKPAPMLAPAVAASAAPVARGVAPLPVPDVPKVDPVAEARALAARANSLDELRAAIGAFEHCEIKRGARNLVFSGGLPGARVLILGEAPGAEEDREGRPFAGRAGQLLDDMLEAIGLSREGTTKDTAVYLTNILPWRCLGYGEPVPDDVAMMRPFIERHIELAAPEVIVVMGNTPLFALTGTRGIARARGQWLQALGRPVLPMLHPDSLLRTPIAKREAWQDLLALEARLSQ